ncbi:hypothetical protein ABT063_21910 [Streptomyces sp. NPDC002838]|uniref:hypothetical protein n=1 Tax=Streptomyces sp. NPDC002838 TaxID=3154436 RepID=UPI0033174112
MHALFPEVKYGGPRDAVLPLPESGPGEPGPVRLLRISLAASGGTGQDGCGPPGPRERRPRWTPGSSWVPAARCRPGHDPRAPSRPGIRRRAARGDRRTHRHPARRTISHSDHHTGPLILLDTEHATAALWLAKRAPGRGRTAVRLDGGAEAPLAAPHFDPPESRAGFAVHPAHVTAGRSSPTGRPVGPRQRADLGAAPGRDWIGHSPALGTTYSQEGAS